MKNKCLQNFGRTFSALFYMLGCVYSCGRAYIFLKIIRSVFDALLSISLLILQGILIDAPT